MPKIKPAYVRSALLIVIALFLSACGHYPSINVTVVDAETSEPIEGAVLLAQWNIVEGIMGLASETNYKVVEEVSDQNGRIKIPGVSNIKLNPPMVTVYKKGYVAWNNQYIFPDYENRKNFQWREGYVFRLERFKPDYTYTDHTYFLNTTNIARNSGIFRDAWRWEALRSLDE